MKFQYCEETNAIQISKFDKKQDILSLSEGEMKELVALWNRIEVRQHIKQLLHQNPDLDDRILDDTHLLRKFTCLWLNRKSAGWSDGDIIEDLYYIGADDLETYQI